LGVKAQEGHELSLMLDLSALALNLMKKKMSRFDWTLMNLILMVQVEKPVTEVAVVEGLWTTTTKE